MKNIILLTHGDFSKGIAQSCRFILGEVPNLIPLSITLNETVEETKTMVETAMETFHNHDPILMITDIPGGSTTQAALRVLEDHPELYLVSGLNLGLLVALIMQEFTTERKENIRLIQTIVEQAKETMMLVNEAAEASELCSDDDEL